MRRTTYTSSYLLQLRFRIKKLFSRFVYKATHCEKVPSALSDVIRVLFVFSQQFDKVHSSDDTFILKSPRKQHLSELMIEISVFKNAGYHCLNAFCRCKIIVFLNQLGVCRQWVCALCFADSSCAVPWWPLYCLNTLTLGSQAGCWGVRSGSPRGAAEVPVSECECQLPEHFSAEGTVQRGWGVKKKNVFGHPSVCSSLGTSEVCLFTQQHWPGHSILCWEAFTHRSSVHGLVHDDATASGKHWQ